MTSTQNYNNTKFITNDSNDTLEARFNKSLIYTKAFDVLVGFFRISGFKKIFHNLENVEKIRILVGLNLDSQSYQYISLANQSEPRFYDDLKIKEQFSAEIENQALQDENEQDLEESARKLIKFIRSKKLEIRAYSKGRLHAKVYIFHFKAGQDSRGKVITGSSNFSESGLVTQREFNVELKDDADLQFASSQFAELWQDSSEISQDFVETITTKTWLNDQITPYEIYLKFLYEYFKEDFQNHNEEFSEYPTNFKQLQYQQDAVNSAFRIINQYKGVFLSDVVGLGKTYMGTMLCKRLIENGHKRVLIIAPPSLVDKNNKGGWHNAFEDFHFKSRQFKCYSLGLLDDITKNEKTENYDIVLIDESHRFRSEKTENYPKLTEICRGKKVILISATPYNNRPSDLLSQIKLFQSEVDSNIPNCKKLKEFFDDLENRLKNLDRQGNAEEYIKISKENAKKIRQKILKYLMVRRTRTQILKSYGDDLKEQKITFPEVENPKPIYYEFNEAEDKIFNETLIAIKDKLTYIRYIPLSKHKTKATGSEGQNKNMKGFMRTLLFKRLESSIDAFKKTIDRFIKSYEGFINAYENGEVYVSKSDSQKIFDYLEAGEDKRIDDLINNNKADRYDAKDFNLELGEELKADLEILKQIRDNWQSISRDPKIIAFKDKLAKEKPFKSEKSIIFTESQETAKYLEEELKSHFNDRVIGFAGSDNAKKREKVLQNFDANSSNPEDDFDILITTDVLAEGVNLHRANVVVNYDLPWNPARMMQRVGRINRIDTKFNKIFIYNFFPSKQSNDVIKLEESAKSKIASFNALLGSDSQLLNDDEEIKSHKLDGRLLYEQMMTSPESDEEIEYLKEDEYRQIIKNIEKEQPELFKKIEKLPKKSRCARKPKIKPENQQNQDCELISFIKKGQLQKFYLVSEQKNNIPQELDFIETAEKLKADPQEKNAKFDNKFFEFLATNKEFFAKEIAQDRGVSINRSNNKATTKLLEAIKASFKDLQNFNEEEKEFISSLKESLQDGNIPSQSCSNINKETNKQKDILNNPAKFLMLLKNNISPNLLQPHQSQINKQQQQEQVIEVILSCYFNNN